MHLVIAQMKHETNTFSPVPTPLGRFSRAGTHPLEGTAAITAFRGTGTGLGALIGLAEGAGASYALPIAASAWPSGPVEDTAFDHICERITGAVRKGCDAVLLDLHGAMVTRTHDDGEGELLRRIRAVAPEVPIGVALDMHTNFSPEIGDLATVAAGYQTYPHIDMHETGLRAGQPILDLLAGRRRPVMSYGFRPMLPHVMRQSSLDSPNREIQARARQMEREGALAATFFVGFPHADIPWAGVSAVVVTDGDRALAQAFRDELLGLAWAGRERFVYRAEPLASSIARARSANSNGRPVVMLDHYDNCASGGTMDTMTVLGAILEAGLDDVAAFAICDPAAVAAMQGAGAGAQITLDLGGKLDMPSIGLTGRPMKLTGSVVRLCEGKYRNEGPMARGEAMDMGPSAVLKVGGVDIVVISRHVEPHDIGSFHAVGIDPARRRHLMLKSRVHWRAGLGDLAGAVIECAGTGVCTSDYSTLDFRRVRRPIYPLDPEALPA